ncbi:MAG: KEOPS complex subunit Pcc1 [Candidatus Bathyarchaeia archaeon]
MTKRLSTSSVADVEITLNDESTRVVLDALVPETEVSTSDRSIVSIHPLEGGVTLRVRADDTVALRAALNSYLRWIKGIIGVLEGI